MHVAVSKGAKKNQGFAYYAQYLADNHYVPPDAKGWVAHIKDKGNEANHEIKVMSSDDAEELLSFSEMLLKQIFEFPARVVRVPDRNHLNLNGKARSAASRTTYPLTAKPRG